VIEACTAGGTFLEVNSNPRRLDLPPPAVRLAAEAGVGVVVSTDAHRVSTLAFMQYGVAIARRGWATAAQIVNTRPWPEVDAMRRGRG
jgi:DNA polymerase (family X)